MPHTCAPSKGYRRSFCIQHVIDDVNPEMNKPQTGCAKIEGSFSLCIISTCNNST